MVKFKVNYKLTIAVVIIVLSAIVYFLTTIKSKKENTESISNKKGLTYSAWLWTSPDSMTKNEVEKMLEHASNYNIKVVYVRLDDYTDIYMIKNVAERNRRVSEFDESVKNFIDIANKFGIVVEALGGNVNWAEESETIYPQTLFKAVMNYNANNPNYQLSGIHFDVETHNSESYKDNKDNALNNFLDLVSNMVSTKENYETKTGRDFKLGFAIPFWYDNQNNNGVEIELNGQKKPIAYHILDLLNHSDHNYVVLMDYRNYADGTDGSIANALNEFEYAEKNAKKVKIVIGQETSKVEPKKITFYDTSKSKFFTEAKKIYESFSMFNTFGGIAIHHLPSFIDL
jgi:hypothetical protein